MYIELLHTGKRKESEISWTWQWPKDVNYDDKCLD